MRLLCSLALLVLLGGCATQSDAIQCAEKRPQVCTMEYNPTCVEQADGSHKEYSSPCNACAHDTVESYTLGACPE